MIFNFQVVGRDVDRDLDAPVHIDMERLRSSLESGELRVPSGLSREERRRFVRESRQNAARG